MEGSHNGSECYPGRNREPPTPHRQTMDDYTWEQHTEVATAAWGVSVPVSVCE